MPKSVQRAKSRETSTPLPLAPTPGAPDALDAPDSPTRTDTGRVQPKRGQTMADAVVEAVATKLGLPPGAYTDKRSSKHRGNDEEQQLRSKMQAVLNGANMCDAAAQDVETGNGFGDEGFDGDWMKALEKTKAGKEVIDYLAQVEAVVHSDDPGVECPVDQVATYRRVLIRALERSGTPFGLPRKLPKFIAVVNLAGRKMLLTTDKPVLFKLLAHSPHGKRATAIVQQSVKKVFAFQETASTDMSLLLVYSMPFQVEMSNLHWDMRTIVRTVDPDGGYKVVDGHIGYEIGENKARPRGCTSIAESPISSALLKAQIDRFGQNVSSTDLDIEIEVGVLDAIDPEAPAALRVQQLEQLLVTLGSERRKMQTNHKVELDEVAMKHRCAMAEAQDAAAVAYEQERSDEVGLQKKVESLQGQLDSDVRALADKTKELRTAKAEHARKELLWAEERKKLESQRALQEASALAVSKQLAKCNADRDKTMRKLEMTNTQTVDAMEKRIQKLVIAERTAKQQGEELVERMKTLSNAMDGSDATHEALNHDLASLRRYNRVLMAMMMLGAQRFKETRTELSQAEAQTTASTVRIDKLALELEAVDGARGGALLAKTAAEAARDQLTKANHQLQCQLEIVQGEKKQKDKLEAAAPVQILKPLTREVATETVRVTTKEELELGELSTKYAKQQDELDAKKKEILSLTAELARQKTKAAKRLPPSSFVASTDEAGGGANATHESETAVVGMPAPPSSNHTNGPYILNQVHINGRGPASTDVGHDATMDPSVEAVVAQAALGLRSLAELAREAQRHKQAATEGWAQVRALQQNFGYPQVPMYQGPPHGHTSGAFIGHSQR